MNNTSEILLFPRKSSRKFDMQNRKLVEPAIQSSKIIKLEATNNKYTSQQFHLPYALVNLTICFKELNFHIKDSEDLLNLTNSLPLFHFTINCE